MKIPKWLSKHLNDIGLTTIREAVTLAEKQTSGEIVPMIVRSSSPTAHLMSMIFFILLSSLELLYLAFAAEYGFVYSLEIQLVVILSSLCLSVVLSKQEKVQRILTPRLVRAQNAMFRAELEFHRSKIRATTAHTGVLLFVSIMERQAVVLADEKIVKLLSPDIWNGVLKTLVEGLKEKDFAVGFSKAIEQAGRILQEHFPVNENDQNELPNDLQIKD